MPESFVELDETKKIPSPRHPGQTPKQFLPFQAASRGLGCWVTQTTAAALVPGAAGDLCKVSLAGVRNLPGEHCQLLIPHTPLAYASPSSCKLIAALNFRHIYLLLLAV